MVAADPKPNHNANTISSNFFWKKGKRHSLCVCVCVLHISLGSPACGNVGTVGTRRCSRQTNTINRNTFGLCVTNAATLLKWHFQIARDYEHCRTSFYSHCITISVGLFREDAKWVWKLCALRINGRAEILCVCVSKVVGCAKLKLMTARFLHE